MEGQKTTDSIWFSTVGMAEVALKREATRKTRDRVEYALMSDDEIPALEEIRVTLWRLLVQLSHPTILST